MAAPRKGQDTEIGADRGLSLTLGAGGSHQARAGEGTAETWQRRPRLLSIVLSPPWPPAPSRTLSSGKEQLPLTSPESLWEEVAACSAQILPQQPSSRTRFPVGVRGAGTTPLLRGVSVIRAPPPPSAPSGSPPWVRLRAVPVK